MLRCPKCMETKFSVNVIAFQVCYGDEDDDMGRWGDVDVDRIGDDKPYFCMNCEKDFDEAELIKTGKDKGE